VAAPPRSSGRRADVSPHLGVATRRLDSPSPRHAGALHDVSKFTRHGLPALPPELLQPALNAPFGLAGIDPSLIGPGSANQPSHSRHDAPRRWKCGWPAARAVAAAPPPCGQDSVRRRDDRTGPRQNEGSAGVLPRSCWNCRELQARTRLEGRDPAPKWTRIDSTAPRQHPRVRIQETCALSAELRGHCADWQGFVCAGIMRRACLNPPPASVCR
jgi:hypothetical protein